MYSLSQFKYISVYCTDHHNTHGLQMSDSSMHLASQQWIQQNEMDGII